MKSSIFLLALVSCAPALYSQATSSSSQSNGAAASKPSAQSGPSSNSSSTPALRPRGPEAVAQQEPNRVVAVINGKSITAREAVEMLKPLPAQDRRRFEANLQGLLQQLYMQEQLSSEAVKLKLDEQSPTKEQLRMARENILTQAYLSKLANTASQVGASDPKQYYDAHPSDFDQVKLRAIFVGFTPPGTPAASAGSVNRTEEQAREKANDLEKKLKAGTDFTTLARTESDNQQSAAKGGELGTFTMGDTGLPSDVKNALTKLQTGQISEPIRIPSGYLILKVDSRSQQTFDQARPAIVQRLQNEKNQAALKQELDKYKIDVKDPDFFNASNGHATPSLRPSAGTAVPPGNSSGSPSASNTSKPPSK